VAERCLSLNDQSIIAASMADVATQPCAWATDGSAIFAVVIGLLCGFLVQWVKNKRSNVNLRSRPEFLGDASKIVINVVLSLVVPLAAGHELAASLVTESPQDAACAFTFAAYVYSSICGIANLIVVIKCLKSRSADQQSTPWDSNSADVSYSSSASSTTQKRVRHTLIWFLTCAFAQMLASPVVRVLLWLTSSILVATSGVVAESFIGRFLGFVGMTVVTTLHVIALDERLMKRTAADYMRVNMGDVDTELQVFGEEEFGDLEDAFEK
jgi:uncharacterized membrane protein